jgi:uncharacterized protein (TIGR04255 family)
MAVPYLGLFWAELRDEYPLFEVHPALEPVIERFGDRPETIAPVGFRLLEKPETPRCWFLDKTGNRLVQVQEDRLIHNWRRVKDEDAYPRYTSVRATFEREYQRLAAFVSRERVGELIPQQCEMTYINHITATRFDSVFTALKSPARGFLPTPEQGAFTLTYQIPGDTTQPLGRLHVMLQPARRRRDDAPLLVLNLTARGVPDGQGLQGTLRFFDRAREFIVRGFCDLTSAEMHKVWERQNG